MSQGVKERLDLTGKVAVVTGASKGIGASIARGLAEFGAQVIVSSRKQDAVDEVAGSLRADGFEATAIAAHVGEAPARQALIERTVETYGGVDILVNNAAINPVFGPVLQTEEAAFDKIIDVNLKAPFELSKLVFPILRDRGGGAIVNISSVGGLRPEPMLGIYSVSKAALVSLTKVLAAEWGPANVRVNAICPGLVKTKFSRALWENEEILKRAVENLPLRRIAEPDEIAPLAVLLASDASGFSTGGVYTIDGGRDI